jgi:hypothetical protein
MKNILILTLVLCATKSFAFPTIPFPTPDVPKAQALPQLNIDPSSVTMSGVSAGAYMSVQMEVAYSKTVVGAGVIAGGIYGCAQGDANRAQNECMRTPSSLNVNDYVSKAQTFASQGKIDDLQNLQNSKVYIYNSPKDGVVNPQNGEKLGQFYNAFMNPQNIHYEKSIESAHGFPTLSEGNPCTLGFMPWILKCNFDAAGAMLQTFYGNLSSRAKAVPQHLQRFSQNEFGDAKAGLLPEGFVYIPESCSNGETCKLHVALHGCQMSTEYTQDKFPTLTGYNDWAEANHIVVLYPQVGKQGSANPYGCWDWWGYSGDNYLTKDAPQMKALFAMIQKLVSK